VLWLLGVALSWKQPLAHPFGMPHGLPDFFCWTLLNSASAF